MVTVLRHLRSLVRAALLWLLAAEGSPGLPAADPLLVVTSLDPGDVGRQESQGAAILDVVAWLRASGWTDDGAGDLQRFALGLLVARAEYERQGAVVS